MAPSESVPAAIANGLPSAPPDFDDVGRAVEPNGHDNGCLDGTDTRPAGRNGPQQQSVEMPSARVLLVDGDPNVPASTTAMIEGFGHSTSRRHRPQTRSACSPQEIDLVLTNTRSRELSAPGLRPKLMRWLAGGHRHRLW